MWLLVAEMRKLARPLVWGTMLTAAGFCVLLAWGASSNAGRSLPHAPSVACPQPIDPACRQQDALRHAGDVTAARATSRLETPGSVGQVAVGMVASLPGVFVIALLAGGHWGGEWSGRTVRTLLVREGRRDRVLFAKWVTLWVAGMATAAACWAALALAGPILTAAYHLPAPGVPLWHGLNASLSAFGHAAVVLALFSAVAVAAGAVSRGQLACTAVTGGIIVVTLIVAGLGSAGRWSPATFVQAWMGFRFNGQFLPTNFWARFVDRRSVRGGAASMPFGEPVALVGLVVWIALAAAFAHRRVAADVNV